MRKKKSLASLLEEENISHEKLEPKEIEDIEKSWKNRFATQTSKDEKGQLWHSFSFNKYPYYKEGKEADQKYVNLLVKEYFIWGGNEGYRCISNKLPDLIKLKRLTRDFKFTYYLYLSHKNLKWSYVYTHEDFFGPYYAE